MVVLTGQGGQVSIQQYTDVIKLLSPIRDSQYLASLTNPTTTAPDAGLGVVDNPFFFRAGHYIGGVTSPSGVQDRLFMCWLGSPKGTTNQNPNFSLFCAQVNESEYSPNAPASAWLSNPFLLLPYDQLSRDAINWFDNNYPTGGTNGVGNPISPTPTTSTVITTASYGNIFYITANSGAYTPPGNISGTPEIKQVHMIYDPIDDTVLLYISFVTPNWNVNSKSIYVYKFPVTVLLQHNAINTSGLTSTTTSTPPPNDKPYFLGGLTLDEQVEQTLYVLGGFFGGTFAPPQFTISYDFMKITTPYGYSLANGNLPAILVAVEGFMPAFGYPATPNGGYPHGNGILAAILNDIHTNPAQTTVFRIPPVVFTNAAQNGVGITSTNTLPVPFYSLAPVTDSIPFGAVIDKFGSITPMSSAGLAAGYVVPYTTPSRPDIRLSSMRLKLLFIEPIYTTPPIAGAALAVAFGVGRPIESVGAGFGFAVTKESIYTPIVPEFGRCRPYVTTEPDGVAKVLFGSYYADEYIEGIAVKIDQNSLSPDYYRELIVLPTQVPLIAGTSGSTGTLYMITGQSGMFGIQGSSFNKKYVRIFGVTYPPLQPGVDGTSVMLLKSFKNSVQLVQSPFDQSSGSNPTGGTTVQLSHGQPAPPTSTAGVYFSGYMMEPMAFSITTSGSLQYMLASEKIDISGSMFWIFSTLQSAVWGELTDD